ncbi:MAG: acetylxylan esterase [bacterium]
MKTDLTGRKTLKRFVFVLFSGLFLVASNALADGSSVHDWPGVDQLPVVEELPNPFLMNDGSMVRTEEDWLKRREEIKEIILHYSYGHTPPPPDNLTAEIVSSKTVYGGAATEKRILLSMGPDRKVTMRIGMIVPKGGGPFPVILKETSELGHVPIARELIERGYIVAEYVRTDLDPDEKNIVGPAQAAYPDYDWATIAVWAWGASRVVDYFMTLDIVDKDRIAVTGHSRGGKTALLAGALDERITLTVPNGSGAGGAGCYRLLGEGSETLKIITTNFPHWFHPRLSTFADKVNRLPFDQHFLKALVAPRALLSTESVDDLWANPYGTQQTHLAAQEVYEFLGVCEKIGIHFRRGQHDQTVEDWQALADFADKMFFGKDVGRNFIELRYPIDEKAAPWAKMGKMDRGNE